MSFCQFEGVKSKYAGRNFAPNLGKLQKVKGGDQILLRLRKKLTDEQKPIDIRKIVVFLQFYNFLKLVCNF